MPSKTMRFAAGRTINVGNYNSARVDYEESITVTDGDDETAAYAALRERVYQRLYGEINAILAAEKPN